jgi:hypothetical protein
VVYGVEFVRESVVDGRWQAQPRLAQIGRQLQYATTRTTHARHTAHNTHGTHDTRQLVLCHLCSAALQNRRTGAIPAGVESSHRS